MTTITAAKYRAVIAKGKRRKRGPRQPPNRQVYMAAALSPNCTEADVQIAAVWEFRATWPEIVIYGSASGVYLGQLNNRKTQKKWGLIKRIFNMGNVSGWPDLDICAARRGYHGWYCEIKKPGEYARANQKEILGKQATQGYLATCVSGFPAFWAIATWYMGATEIEPWDTKGIRRF